VTLLHKTHPFAVRFPETRSTPFLPSFQHGWATRLKTTFATHHRPDLRSSIPSLRASVFQVTSTPQHLYSAVPRPDLRSRGTSLTQNQHAASPRPSPHTRHRLRANVEPLQSADSIWLPRRPCPRHQHQCRLHKGRPVLGLLGPRRPRTGLRPGKWPDAHGRCLGRRPRARFLLVHHVRPGRRRAEGRPWCRHRQQRRFFLLPTTLC
jgi:hypothetical protein